MALTTDIRFLWPPNFDGNPPENGGWKKVILHLTAICEGQYKTAICEGQSCGEESDVVKLDISELRKIGGTVPTRTVVEKIEWDISGLSNVLLEWDRAPDAIIAVLSARGKIENDLTDQGDDLTGDILLTTDGMVDGSSYDIVLTVRLK